MKGGYCRGVFKYGCYVCRMLRLVHFKCTHDQSWNYEEQAKKFFGVNKCMVQLEKIGANDHAHFQGYTTLSERMMKDRISEMSKGHYVNKSYQKELEAWEAAGSVDKLKPKCPRPIRMVRKEVDEVGFQYLMKEGHLPVFYQGFTVEELNAMAVSSDEHVKSLKNGLKEHVHKRKYSVDPVAARKRMRLDALEYYVEEKKRPRGVFQKDVLWCMYTHPDACDDWKEFVAENI